MIPLDYFVVGPQVALETRSHAGHASRPRLDLTVLEPRNREIGWLKTEHAGDHIVIETHWSTQRAGDRHQSEALQLAARILGKLTPVEVRVRTDATSVEGFRRRGDFFVADPASLQATARADSMEELYADPFNVVWNFEPRPWETLAPLLAEAGRHDAFDVLDIGCGFGKNSRLLERLGVRAHGIDVAKSAIDRCKQWMRHPDRFMSASLDALPHDDAMFDAVLDVGCLHCLPPELRVAGISEIARTLKPGGWLFSRVLLPRDRHWLAAQPYAVTALGMDPPELVKLLEPMFEVSFAVDSQAVQLRARRRA